MRFLKYIYLLFFFKTFLSDMIKLYMNQCHNELNISNTLYAYGSEIVVPLLSCQQNANTIFIKMDSALNRFICPL